LEGWRDLQFAARRMADASRENSGPASHLQATAWSGVVVFMAEERLSAATKKPLPGRQD
jgi:hypothetical protein